jgi:FlgD Ig-like domain
LRQRILRVAPVVGFLCYAAVAFAFSHGPDASRTGAPAVAGRPAELLCTQCHLGSPINDPAGKLEILDLPDQYEPGVNYPMRLRLSFSDHLPEDIPRWGFQITAVQASTGRGVGLWMFPIDLQVKPATNQTSWPGRLYLEHTFDALHEGDPGPVEWSFSWTAPPGDSGAVYFFAAGNAANGDGCSTCGGDHIFTARDTLLSSSIVGVPIVPVSYSPENVLEAPSPNPMKQCVDLPFSIARSGHVDLSIYDVQGRKVRTLTRGWHDAGPGAGFWNGKREDGTVAANGVYFVRLIAPGLQRPLVRRLTLAH